MNTPLITTQPPNLSSPARTNQDEISIVKCEDGTSVSIRQVEGEYFQTIKSPVGLPEEGITIPITEEQYKILTAKSSEPEEKSQEIERKWRIESLPELAGVKSKEVIQGYIAIAADGTEIRVRQKGEKYFQTIKGDGDLVRNEIEIELSEDQYRVLWEGTSDRRLEKTRYEILHNGAKIELDVYHGNLNGLVVTEVEFKNIEDSKRFQAPVWFGEDVTKDKRYKNKNLVLYGIPQ